MNRTEFESKYKAKYLNLLPEDEANKFIDDNREDEGYTDDHLNVCWRNYVMQCAIDFFCEKQDWAAKSWKDQEFIKPLFDLRSKEV